MTLFENVNATRANASLFGALFLLAFVAYGAGSGMTASVTDAPGGLADIPDRTTMLVSGALLMGVLHSLANLGVAGVMTTVLKPYHRVLAYGYFGAVLLSTLMLAVGSVFLLLLSPLAEAFAKGAVADAGTYELLAALFEKANFISYQVGMTLWGLGGIAFCVLLYRSRLVPRFLSVWGLIGYPVFILGAALELLGFGVGLAMSAPGGLFEIVLAFWLLIRGFSPDAVSSPAV